MLSGRLVWAGDHFTPVEIAQLRRDRERKARAWLRSVTGDVNGAPPASLILLVVPEDSINAGVLLDQEVDQLDPSIHPSQDHGQVAEILKVATSPHQTQSDGPEFSITA